MKQRTLLDPGSPYLTIPAASVESGIPAPRIRRAVQRGEIPAFRTGRLRRVRLSDVQRAMGAE